MNPFSATDVYEVLEREVVLGALSMEDLVTVGVSFARLTVYGINAQAVMFAFMQAWPQHTARIYQSFEKPCPEADVWAALERRYPGITESGLGQIIERDLAALRE